MTLLNIMILSPIESCFTCCNFPNQSQYPSYEILILFHKDHNRIFCFHKNLIQYDQICKILIPHFASLNLPYILSDVYASNLVNIIFKIRFDEIWYVSHAVLIWSTSCCTILCDIEFFQAETRDKFFCL